MPSYEFECQTCGHRHTVVMKMSEYDEYPKTCQEVLYQGGNIAHRPPCGGDLIQVYDNRETQNFILQGGGWTPKFGPINRG